MRIIHISTTKYHPCFSETIALQAQRHQIIFILLEPSRTPKYNLSEDYTEGAIRFLHLRVRSDADFEDDRELESSLAGIFRVFSPEIIHIQVFNGVNIRAILRAGSCTAAKKFMTLHIHSLFCVSGTCSDKKRTCYVDSLESCSCEGCKDAARRNRVTLIKYNRTRKTRYEECVALTDTIICCSFWQKTVLSRLFGNEAKLLVLHYGVPQPPKYKHKEALKRSEIESAGLEWNSFRKKMAQNVWAKQVNHETIRFNKLARNEIARIKTFLGADFAKLESALRQSIIQRPSKHSVPTFGFLGSLWELKGVEVLLAAVKQLHRHKFKLIMGIMLPSATRQSLAVLQKATRYPEVQLQRNISREDLYEKFFSQIDYLIIPSQWEETGPMPLFEAFYYKIPVIISAHPSMVEKIKPGINAEIFTDADGLTKIMEDVVQKRITFGRKNRTNFPVRTAKEYTTILERVYTGKIISDYREGDQVYA